MDRQRKIEGRRGSRRDRRRDTGYVDGDTLKYGGKETERVREREE